MKCRILILTMAFSLFVVTAQAAEYRPEVKTKEILRSSTTVTGRDIVYPKTDRAVVTASTVEIPPGSETGWHTHPVPLYAWVVSGTLTVEFEGGKKVQFTEGDAIIEAVNTPQNGKNSGTIPVKLLVFATGAEDVPNVVKTLVYDSAPSAQGTQAVPAAPNKSARQETQSDRQVAPENNAAKPEKKDNSINIKLRYNDPVIE